MLINIQTAKLDLLKWDFIIKELSKNGEDMTALEGLPCSFSTKNKKLPYSQEMADCFITMVKSSHRNQFQSD